MVDEGPAVLRPVVGMHGQSRPLIYQEDILILIDDVQLRRGHRQIGVVLPGLFKKLVVDVQLQHVSRVQPGVPLDALAIAFDPLDADIFLRQRSRQQGNRFRQKPVQPLPRVIGADSEFFHTFSVFVSLECGVAQ